MMIITSKMERVNGIIAVKPVLHAFANISDDGPELMPLTEFAISNSAPGLSARAPAATRPFLSLVVVPRTGPGMGPVEGSSLSRAVPSGWHGHCGGRWFIRAQGLEIPSNPCRQSFLWSKPHCVLVLGRRC
jgi:hypothetical protein